MPRTAKESYPAFIAFFARPVLLFYALPWLMLLLVAGTVAQRYVGLYASQRLFFGSFILWVGYIPLPGAYSVLSVIALSLLVKLVLYTAWEKRQCGIILTHLSAVILLVGGLVTASFRQEGYIVLAQGGAGDTVSDYYARELAVERNGSVIATFPLSAYTRDVAVTHDGLPFTLRVIRYCRQCSIAPRTQVELALQGVARKVELAAAPESGKPEAQGQSGAMLELSGLPGGQDGIYVTAQALKDQPQVRVGGDRYTIVLRPAECRLPFSLMLSRFTKSDYPGTDMARSYRSDVLVKDGAVQWDAVIQMNQPLRYKGYTLYQSSFVENGEAPMTVLAVVKNAGEWFPYFSIATLCGGLLLHMIITFTRKEGGRA